MYNLQYESHNTILAYAKYAGTTNINGAISFSAVDAYTDYRVYVYFDSVNRDWGNNYYDIECDENETAYYDIEVDEYSLGLP